jgi:hypothetical protein
MRFGIFYEHQLPRPWAHGDEEKLLSDALEQVEIADRVGIDYVWEVESVRARRREPLRRLAGQARAAMRESSQERTRVGLHRWIERVGDDRAERVFGVHAVQRALFAMIARQYDPRVGGAFSGEIGYELTTSDGRVQQWTIEVADGRARARAGLPRDPVVLLLAPVADFVRSLAGEQQVRSILEGRTRIEGDIAMAYRITEMFGGRIPY